MHYSAWGLEPEHRQNEPRTEASSCYLLPSLRAPHFPVSLRIVAGLSGFRLLPGAVEQIKSLVLGGRTEAAHRPEAWAIFLRFLGTSVFHHNTTYNSKPSS